MATTISKSCKITTFSQRYSYSLNPYTVHHIATTGPTIDANIIMQIPLFLDTLYHKIKLLSIYQPYILFGAGDDGSKEGQ